MYYLKAYLLKDLEKKRLKPSDHGIFLIHHVAWPWNRKNISVPSCPYKTAFYCYNTFWGDEVHLFVIYTKVDMFWSYCCQLYNY